MKILVLFPTSMNTARKKDNKEGAIKLLSSNRFSDRRRVITEKMGRRMLALYLVSGFTTNEKITTRQRKMRKSGKEKLFTEERKKVVITMILKKSRDTFHNLLESHIFPYNPYDNVVLFENFDFTQKF